MTLLPVSCRLAAIGRAIVLVSSLAASACAATVGITAPDAVAKEGTADQGSFLITISAAQATPVTVYYNTSGTATIGIDYDGPTGSAVIPAGATSVAVPVHALADTVTDKSETVILTITGYSTPLTVGIGTATVTILDATETNVAPPPTKPGWDVQTGKKI